MGVDFWLVQNKYEKNIFCHTTKTKVSLSLLFFFSVFPLHNSYLKFLKVLCECTLKHEELKVLRTKQKETQNDIASSDMTEIEA